jgi:hypothetical protein
LVAARPFSAGDVIARFAGYQELPHPTRYSIQISPQRHIDDLGALANLNHSCAPSTLVDTEALTLVAARDLAAGDELTYFYPSTEWEMSVPFTCLCGAPECLGRVAGAKHVPPTRLRRYVLNRHIRELAGL